MCRKYCIYMIYILYIFIQYICGHTVYRKICIKLHIQLFICSARAYIYSIYSIYVYIKGQKKNIISFYFFKNKCFVYIVYIFLYLNKFKNDKEMMRQKKKVRRDDKENENAFI